MPDYSLLPGKDGLLTTRSFNILLFLLVIIYLPTRLFLLAKLPLFLDESSYIHWAQYNVRGVLEDGKFLSIAVMALFVRGLPGAPIWAARLSSVVSGTLALLLLVYAGRLLYTRRDGLLAGFCYILLPFAVFFDRVALTDNLLFFFAACVLVLTILAVRRYRMFVSPLLAVALIGAMLAKLTGAVLMALPVFAVVILTPRRRWRWAAQKIFPALLGAGIVCLSLVLNSYGVSQGRIALSEVSAFEQLLLNMIDIADTAWHMLTPPWVVVSVVMLIWAAGISRKREDYFLLAILVIFVLPISLKARILYPRYLTLALLPLTLLLGRFLGAVGQQINAVLQARSDGPALRLVIFAPVLVVLVAWPVFVSSAFILDPVTASLPRLVRWQYIAGWPAGTGLEELAAFLQEQASAEDDGLTVQRLTLLNPANFSLDTVLGPSEDVYFEDFYPTLPDLAGEMLAQAQNAERRTVLVLGPSLDVDHQAGIDHILGDYFAQADVIWEYIRPGGENSLQVWEVRPAG